MKYVMGYTSELFIFLQLLGFIHAPWWWLIWFIFADTGTFYWHRRENALDRETRGIN